MSNTKKITIISITSVVLVAAVVAVVLTATRSQPGEGVSGSVTGPVSTTNKNVQAICQPTDYKEVCEKSLENANSTDPRELIKLGFNAAIKDLSNALNRSETLQLAAKDPRTAGAYDVCQDVLNTAIDDLQRSINKVGAFEMSRMDDYTADLRTWLSGVITHQETCIDAFDNTTGEASNKMKKLLETSSQLSSNALAMVTEINKVLSSLKIPGISRKLLTEGDAPDWVNDQQRRLLQAAPKPNVVVALDGSGQFKSINQALKLVPKKNTAPFVIFIKAGVYREYVEVPRKVDNVVFIGEGATKTKITGNKNYADGVNTYRTATVAINGDGFVAKDIGFENTAGAIKHQAVALRVSGDRAVFFRCQMDGFQDTLYTHAYRQFYRDCTISGTIDFIFGDAAAVFQNCRMIVRKPMDNQACMVTAQGRKEHRGTGGLVLQKCFITAEPALKAAKPAIKSYLGRPWKEFSRTIIMQSFIDSNIAPEGWSPWMGTFGLDTLYYGEYQNKGPGADTARRVAWKGLKKNLSQQEALQFTARTFIQGDAWVASAAVPYDAGL